MVSRVNVLRAHDAGTETISSSNHVDDIHVYPFFHDNSLTWGSDIGNAYNPLCPIFFYNEMITEYVSVLLQMSVKPTRRVQGKIYKGLKGQIGHFGAGNCLALYNCIAVDNFP